MHVVGFTADADTWCPACLPYPEDGEDSEGNGIGAIFDESEWDSPVHCTACHALLETALTAEGAEYVREAVKAFEQEGRGSEEVIAEWREAFPWALDHPSEED